MKQDLFPQTEQRLQVRREFQRRQDREVTKGVGFVAVVILWFLNCVIAFNTGSFLLFLLLALLLALGTGGIALQLRARWRMIDDLVAQEALAFEQHMQLVAPQGEEQSVSPEVSELLVNYVE